MLCGNLNYLTSILWHQWATYTLEYTRIVTYDRPLMKCLSFFVDCHFNVLILQCFVYRLRFVLTIGVSNEHIFCFKIWTWRNFILRWRISKTKCNFCHVPFLSSLLKNVGVLGRCLLYMCMYRNTYILYNVNHIMKNIFETVNGFPVWVNVYPRRCRLSHVVIASIYKASLVCFFLLPLSTI